MASSLNGTYQEEDVLDNVYTALKRARKYKLESEVIATAFKYLKENPEETILECLLVGLADWDI